MSAFSDSPIRVPPSQSCTRSPISRSARSGSCVRRILVTRVSRVPKQKVSTRRPASIAAYANCISAREYGAMEPLMSRMSTNGRRRVPRVRQARSNGSPWVLRDRRRVRRRSNVAPLEAGRVRRVRSTGTLMLRRRIKAATRRRSSSVRSPKDLCRRTSDPLATILIAVSSSASSCSASASSSSRPCHSAARVPASTSSRASAAASSVTGGDVPTPGIVSSTVSSSVSCSESHHRANASSNCSRSSRRPMSVVRAAQ